MEGGQERDSSPDEQRHIIDDDDMEASPTDSADLWLPERNEEDTMFERALTDAIPTKKRPQSVSELAIVQQRKNLFRDLVKGGNQTQTLSVSDKYLRDAVRPMIWKKNAVTFPNGKELPDDAVDVVEVSMEDAIREEIDGYQRKAWTVRLPDPSRAQACEVCTLEDPDEWWAYQRRIGNSFPLLYEVWQCVSSRSMSSGQIERDFDAASDVLTRKRGNTDPTYFQAQTTSCVNFP